MSVKGLDGKSSIWPKLTLLGLPFTGPVFARQHPNEISVPIAALWVLDVPLCGAAMLAWYLARDRLRRLPDGAWIAVAPVCWFPAILTLFIFAHGIVDLLVNGLGLVRSSAP